MFQQLGITLLVLTLSGFLHTNAQSVATTAASSATTAPAAQTGRISSTPLPVSHPTQSATPTAVSTPGPASAASATGSRPPAIRINQIGYYPQAPKTAIVLTTDSSDQFFYILSAAFADSLAYQYVRDTVYTGHLGPLQHSTNSSLSTRLADFSALTKKGRYKIMVPGLGESYPFFIGPHAAEAPARASLKGFYYQRSNISLEPAYAGKWSRPAGHPDTLVLVHPSAASDNRPAGTIISSPGGWYDAGDYNKYIVNSGITMGTLLSAYEDFPEYYDTLHTNIPPPSPSFARTPSAGTSAPQGPSAVPDILNETLFNLRWMLTMQDPADGGVYHKCTNAVFDGMVMPGVTKAPRYVVQKGSAATLDFAAVMAQAARILRKFPKALPGLADSCLNAATHAWSWATSHPAVVYDQEVMNKLFDPKVTTGGYGDRDFKDEWFWAAVELMVTSSSVSAGHQLTSKSASSAAPVSVESYKKIIKERMDDPAGLPSWASVHLLGNYTLLRFRYQLPAEWKPLLQSTAQHLLLAADSYLARVPNNAFHTVMGGSPRDFVWGSNAVAANQGILLIYAWLQTGDKNYIDGALGNLDYILGRNATGYCFLTGMGSYSPLHPHHRPSVADGITLPVPGLLAGGANPGRQDHQLYEFTEPETAYLDQDQAYAANEIAINWNAPMVYLAGALEALQFRAGYSKK